MIANGHVPRDGLSSILGYLACGAARVSMTAIALWSPACGGGESGMQNPGEAVAVTPAQSNPAMGGDAAPAAPVAQPQTMTGAGGAVPGAAGASAAPVAGASGGGVAMAAPEDDDAANAPGDLDPGGESTDGGTGAGDADPAGATDVVSGGACTREFLSTTVDHYFAALAAHAPSMLSLASTVKFTENGETLELGEGLWATAGMVKFKETLLDTEKCGTVTQAVVPDGSTDIPLAVRLQLEAQQITEIQTIAVRRGDYLVASNTDNMLALTPWGEIVPETERQTREELARWIDKYFRMFPMGVCNLASECRRMENGFTLQCSAGASCSDREPSGAGVMQPQIILADVEAGMVAGFTMFLGSYTDVHMVKYTGGEVHGVHTILGSARSSGWD